MALLSWDFPGKNTRVGCHFLLQAIILTLGLNPCLLHWQADFFFFKPPSHQGSIKTKWVWLVISQILKSQSGKIHPKWKQNKTLILGPKVSLSFTEGRSFFISRGKKCWDSCFCTATMLLVSWNELVASSLQLWHLVPLFFVAAGTFLSLQVDIYS